MPDACRRYHDHVASIYDDIYGRSPYWDFYHEISWGHMKPVLPRDISLEVHDVGCGTGIYGIRLLKAGFRVLFSDISPKMLDAARRNVEKAGFSDRATFAHFSVDAMEEVEDGRFALICAQGDPVSLCPDPAGAFREVGRTLAPGGAAVISVDHRLAGYEHFLEKADLAGLQKFHRDGMLTWLAKKQEERFPFHTLERKDLERFARRSGLQLESLIGKIVLPVRKHPALLEEGKAFRALLRIERSLHDKETCLGQTSHLQGIFRKPVSGKKAR